MNGLWVCFHNGFAFDRELDKGRYHGIIELGRHWNIEKSDVIISRDNAISRIAAEGE